MRLPAAAQTGLSKNFSFWTAPLGFFAMLKIKSLMYKDLIFNSRGCRKSNQLLSHPRVYPISDKSKKTIKNDFKGGNDACS